MANLSSRFVFVDDALSKFHAAGKHLSADIRVRKNKQTAGDDFVCLISAETDN